jgi:serum/glucocorticoid-regulated kinase 2
VGKPESKLIFKSQNSGKVEAFEEFEIVKVLGRGAFGKVMLCKHGSTGTYYAVKSMRK